MYVPFTTVHKRRMMLLREHDANYLVRVYMADGVDMHHRDNTYLEVMTLTNPIWPKTLKIVDRSFLNQKNLQITDFKLYMGNMFITDYHSGVIVFNLNPDQHIAIFGRYRSDSGFLRLGIYSGNEDDEFILALANSHAIYEIDFTNQMKPDIIAKYSIMSNSHIQSIWVNRHYVVAQFTANATSPENITTLYNTTIVFSRKTRSYMNAHEIFEHNSSNVIIDLERSTDYLMIMNETKITYHRMTVPMLVANPT